MELLRDRPEPRPPLPLLVTGVAGVAGYAAFRHFQRLYPGQVIGTRRVDNWRLQGEGIVGVDVDDHHGFAELFRRHRFAAVLNCEGSCALKACELDPPSAWRVNVFSVENLLEQLDGRGRLVHLSIDLVFSGLGDGGHRETDPTDPVTVYGRTMAQAESLVLQHSNACLLRISLPMGVSFNGHAGAIDWIQSRFKKDKPATLYFDEVRTPTYCDCLNRVFAEVLANDLRGLFHAGGPRRLSLFQIAQIVNRVGGYDPDLLQGCPRIDAGPMPPRAGDVSMDSSLLADALAATPFDPWPVDPRWLPTDDRWHYRREGHTGSEQLLREQLYLNPDCGKSRE
ncbi:MAG: sugar nucleotide-binding protein [Planctomycetales bacterium]|nr:sugar nucleotide-binding protein [Planctomycetales bacterium]